MGNRYWRATSPGNWGDVYNWSSSSGGPPNTTIPGPADDVFFDVNGAGNCTLNINPSVTSITVDTTYGGTISASSKRITLSGDFTIGNTSGLFDAGTSTLVMAGSSTQTLTIADISNNLCNLRVANDTALGSDIRLIDGVLTIESGSMVDLHPSIGVGYDVYLRGIGTVLDLGGYFNAFLTGDGNNGHVIYELAQDGETINITGGTDWNSDGGYTAAGIFGLLIGAISGTFNLKGDLGNIDHFGIWGSTTGGALEFNTNGYNITVFSFLVWGDTSIPHDAVLTCNFDGSTITWDQLNRFVGDDGATYNLQTSTWVGAYWSAWGLSAAAITTLPTFNIGTSSVNLDTAIGEVWFDDGPGDFYDLTIDNAGGTVISYEPLTIDNSCAVNADTIFELDESATIEELIADADIADITIQFNYIELYDIAKLTLSGIDPYRVNLVSSLPGSQWDVSLSNYSVVNNVDVQDSNLSGAEVDAVGDTNDDSGNNSSNWIFQDEVTAVWIGS